MGTIKIKTSELTGVALDWAVAKCEEFKECIVFGRGTVKDKGFYKEGSRDPMLLRPTHNKWVKECEGYPWHTNQKIWEPSTNWSQGGPIIEREGIYLRAVRYEGHSLNGQWLAQGSDSNTGAMMQWVKREGWKRHYYVGPTLLIAAMRCYVASKLGGDEVDIPKELL